MIGMVVEVVVVVVLINFAVVIVVAVIIAVTVVVVVVITRRVSSNFDLLVNNFVAAAETGNKGFNLIRFRSDPVFQLSFHLEQK